MDEAKAIQERRKRDANFKLYIFDPDICSASDVRTNLENDEIIMGAVSEWKQFISSTIPQNIASHQHTEGTFSSNWKRAMGGAEDEVKSKHQGPHFADTGLQVTEYNKMGFSRLVERRASLRYSQAVFKIWPMLSYRAIKELNRHTQEIDTAALSRGGSTEGKEAKDEEEVLEGLRYTAQNERRQNEQAPIRERGLVVKYGDVVQLQHVESGLFMKMRGKTALLDKQCKGVALADGSTSSYFIIMPRYKNRSIGSPIYYSDDIFLVSKKNEGFHVHASRSKFYASARSIIQNPQLRINTSDNLGSDLPRSIDTPLVSEVNGSRDFFSFKIKVHARRYSNAHGSDALIGTLSLETGKEARDEYDKSLQTSVGFRFYHPEAHAFVQASGDPTKGTPSKKGSSTPPPESYRVRSDNKTPSHTPYLKSMEENRDVSNPNNLNVKSLWAFEYPDRSKGGAVKFNMPIRIRHLASGKYLSVNTISLRNPSSEACPCALVHDVDLTALPESFGSEQSMIFYVVPMDLMQRNADEIPATTTTIRLEHRITKGNEVIRLQFYHTDKPKIDNNSAKAHEFNSHQDTRIRSTSIVFSRQRRAQDALRMLISRELDVAVTNRIVGVRSVLDGFRWRMENERNIDKLMDVVEPCADLLLAVVDDVTRGDGFGEDLASYTTAEFLKKAADDSMTPGKLSSLFTGKPKTWMQNLVVDCKLYANCTQTPD